MDLMVSLGIWLFVMTLFLVDTEITLRFVGRYADPHLRLGWWTALLLVPWVTLLLSPLRTWAAAGLALAAAWGLVRHAAAYRVLRRRLPGAPEGVVERVRALAREFGVRQLPKILYDPSDRMEPAAVGLFRPALVLTPSALDLPEQDFRAVVAHELAHALRRDPLRLWAGGITGAVLGWHPLIRRACRLFTLEVEMAADWQAAAWAGDRRAYALALGRWGLRRHGDHGSPVGAAFATAPADLLPRLHYLLDPTAAAPHLRPPLGLRDPGPGRRGSGAARWAHLAMAAAYTALCAVMTRVF